MSIPLLEAEWEIGKTTLFLVPSRLTDMSVVCSRVSTRRANAWFHQQFAEGTAMMARTHHKQAAHAVVATGYCTSASWPRISPSGNFSVWKLK